jgi:hypothetical protein
MVSLVVKNPRQINATERVFDNFQDIDKFEPPPPDKSEKCSDHEFLP